MTQMGIRKLCGTLNACQDDDRSLAPCPSSSPVKPQNQFLWNTLPEFRGLRSILVPDRPFHLVAWPLPVLSPPVRTLPRRAGCPDGPCAPRHSHRARWSGCRLVALSPLAPARPLTDRRPLCRPFVALFPFVLWWGLAAHSSQVRCRHFVAYSRPTTCSAQQKSNLVIVLPHLRSPRFSRAHWLRSGKT